MPRGRPSLNIDKYELEVVIESIEKSENPPKTHRELWERVSSSEWGRAQGKKGMSPSSAASRARKFGLKINTPKGVVHPPGKRINDKPLKPRKKKLFRVEIEKEVEKEFEALGPRTVHALLEGKTKAAIKAMCYACSGHSKAEVAICQIYTCPLWPHRPWRKTIEAADTTRRQSLKVL